MATSQFDFTMIDNYNNFVHSVGLVESESDATKLVYRIYYTNGTYSEFAVNHGQNGAKGDKGDKGDTGATGTTGATGPQGASGANGKDAPVTPVVIFSVVAAGAMAGNIALVVFIILSSKKKIV